MERIELNGRFDRIVMSQDEYEEGTSNYQGVCTHCGELADSVEPDAENYECTSCLHMAVFGFEQLVILGQLEIEE